jgi:hypothetical protein
VTDVAIHRFDSSALYSALDARRLDLGLSRKQVAEALWQLFFELKRPTSRSPDQPFDAHQDGDQAPHHLSARLVHAAMVGSHSQSFLVGAVDGDDLRFALPRAGPDRRLRWSLKLLWTTMDERRRQEGLNWRQLAEVLDCTSSQLTGLRTARFATGMDLAMPITQWIGRPAADFVNAARW